MTLSLLALCFYSGIVAQETEEVDLQLDRLGWKDVRVDSTLSTGTKVISGSRSEKDLNDLPFTIVVITAEEIRKNGYLTLVDALKRLPGIRVSQPGLALEGETFLMRGLLGNGYAKILINDVPIKPFLVSGMPIGAQLPIREAERIEVIYGPSATLYGADASAGVINIILKESNRPVFIQSDLGSGINGFENLDIMFSGKIGKSKNTLSFQAFGNYTAYNDRNVKYDRASLYDPNFYQNLLQSNNSYLDIPNYQGGDGTPILANLPHLSSSLGLRLKYRNWEFSTFRFNRRDHSSLGLSPYAVSYATPNNFFGERIRTIDLKYQNSFGRLNFKFGAGQLVYDTNDQNSYTYVDPVLRNIQVFAIDSSSQLSPTIDERFFSNERYSTANSTETYANLFLSYQLTKHIELATGVDYNHGIGTPLLNFYPNPVNEFTNQSSSQFLNVDDALINDLSLFVEGYFNVNKWNVILGAQVFSRFGNFVNFDNVAFNPRLALQYKWSDQFSMRFSAGRSLKYPSPYYSASSYIVDFENPGVVQTGADLSPERTISAEIGSRWQMNQKISGDFSLYHSRTVNFISHVLRINETGTQALIGYVNDQDAFAQLTGIQSSIKFNDIVESIGLNTTLNINYSQGKEQLNVLDFSSATNNLLEIDGVRSQPNLISQIDIEFAPFTNARLSFENTILSKSRSKNISLYQVDSNPDNPLLTNDGFYTLDLTFNYQFNKFLLGFVRCNNVFNKEYAGIDAASDADGLIYTPQPKRFFRIGLNYRID